MSAATMVMPEFPTLTPKMLATKRVVSICPIPRFKNIPIGNCIFPFRIPAQGRNQYHLMEVKDTYTRIRTGFQEKTDAGVHYANAPIPALDLANSLANEWNRSLSPVGSLGVAVVPDHIQEGTPEFTEFLSILTGQLREVAEWAIRQANDLAGNSKSQFITDAFHRTLARWLMGEDAARAITWYNAQAINELKMCIACGDSINSAAKVCKSCGTDLVDYFIKYNLDPSSDPIVAAVVMRVKVPVQTQGTTAPSGAPPLVRVNLPNSKLPSEARAACVTAMTGEQKADLNTKKGQDERDEFVIGIIPELCLKNAGLRETLLSKGYVIPNPE